MLKDAKVNPSNYSDPISYFKDNSIVCFLKKFPYWPSKTDPTLEAKKKFLACEAQCRQTNRIFRSGKVFQTFSADNAILYIAQKKISDILGDCPSPADLDFEFGPGSTYGVKFNTTPLHKLGSALEVTETCYAAAEEFLLSCPGWRTSSNLFVEGPPHHKDLTVVIGDRLSFVPKTALTDRPIAIGPLVNVLLQKGIGSVIRKRLKPYNDLNKLQIIHKRQAMLASVQGHLATVDLESASDTISYELVKNLLPLDWFLLLDACRSQKYEIEGKVYPYSKFSAMGNGYTFELESLIFFSLAFAVCKYYGLGISDVSAFGDDIIVPTTAYEHLERVLSLCGFTINSEKSYNEGPFRESCGGDYFNGISVRGFYLKDRISYRTLFLFHNFLVKEGWQFVFQKTYRYIRSLLGKKVISYFRTWNKLDDNALLDLSMIVSSYNSLSPRYKGLKSNRLKRAYGFSFLLYRLSRSDKPTENDFDWKNHRLKSTRLYYRPYRYLHF